MWDLRENSKSISILCRLNIKCEQRRPFWNPNQSKTVYNWHFKPVWLRGRCCVFLKTHWVNIWLKKNIHYICIPQFIACECKEMKSSNLLLFAWPNWVHCSTNSGACLHCSLNNFYFFYRGGMPPLFAE